MHYILHIDTSGEKGIIAVSGGGKSLHQKINADSRNHASSINSMIADVLSEAGISLQHLSAVSVIGGPGSYTGLRIGLATAKALCYVLEKPLMLHNKLDMLALQAAESLQDYDLYAAVLPAREREFFMTIYDKNGLCTMAPKHIFEDELNKTIAEIHRKMLITGLLNKTISHIESSTNIKYYENESIGIDFWSHYAFRSFNCNDFVNLANSEPFYLKQVYTHNKL